MKNNPFEQFMNAFSEDDISELQHRVNREGYPFFRRLLDRFEQKIKEFTDSEFKEMMDLIDKAQKIFPQPGKISPSWEYVWERFEQTITFKINALESIALEERNGDWQVVMDNPHTNQEVVCYPSLSFMEAAYLYAYFRPGLEKNEYIQIQKVHRLITEYGS